MKRRVFLLAGAAMIFAAGATRASSLRQVFPTGAAPVFVALVAVLPELGFKVRSVDPRLRRVAFSAGVSAFSWGELLSAAVVEEAVDRAVLEVDGEARISGALAAKGRILKHFDRIASAVGERLALQPQA